MQNSPAQLIVSCRDQQQRSRQRDSYTVVEREYPRLRVPQLAEILTMWPTRIRNRYGGLAQRANAAAESANAEANLIRAQAPDAAYKQRYLLCSRSFYR
jgi:hypothetical protein